MLGERFLCIVGLSPDDGMIDCPIIMFLFGQRTVFLTISLMMSSDGTSTHVM